MNKFLPIIMSGILALPVSVFAASSVRTLGGAGTYNGVTSVGSGTATRAGSVRAVPSVKVSKTTTSATTTPSTSGTTGGVSGNTGAGTRMSMGKYLSGLGAAATKVSTSTTTAAISDVQGLVDELGLKISALESSDDATAAELASLWVALDAATKELEEDYVTKKFLEDLEYIDEDALDKALADLKLEETYAKKGDIPTSTTIAGIIADAVEAGDLELKGYAKTSVLENYATTADVNDVFIGLGDRVSSLEAGAGSLDLPTCGDGNCLYMLGGDKNWQEISVTNGTYTEQ